MKVAIIGAGLAGLYCAHELERLGTAPDIYEMRSYVGEAISHITAILDITHRPHKDMLQYFRKDLALDITPYNVVRSLEHRAPNKTTTLYGHFGYFFKYTRDPDSLKVQMYNKLKKSRLFLNEYGDYERLAQKYDYVVIANGTSAAAEEQGIWQSWLKTYVRGAVVLGSFDPTRLIVWLNKDYTKNGYAYLTAFDNKKASLILIATEVNEKEVDRYWELFLYSENIRYPIVEEFKMAHTSGFAYPHRLGNLYFIGNAGGGVEPFLGFGHINAAVMGVSTARSIMLGKDYEKQIKEIMDRNIEMRQFRKLFNTMTNAGYDMLVTALGMPGVVPIIYNTNINATKYGALFSKLILKPPYR